MATLTSFLVHQEAAQELFGTSPKLSLLYENPDYPFAHEAGVFIEKDNSLIVTSNQFTDPVTHDRKIQITKVHLPPDGASETRYEEIKPVGAPMGNGGVNYQNGILICAQGTKTEPGGIIFMDSEPPYNTRSIVSSFHGRQFNSVNDVVVHSDGSIWFTDPIYGYEQGIRPIPQLPNQVYRYHPDRGSIRAMADGFGRPNGLCFSPDEKIVYITDTDYIHGDGTTDHTRPSTM
jgi:gluconolactonase